MDESTYANLWHDAGYAVGFIQKWGKPTNQYRHRLELGVLRRWLAPGSVLDVGAGFGRMAVPLGNDHEVAAIEGSPIFRDILYRRGVAIVGEDIYDVAGTEQYDNVLCLHTYPSTGTLIAPVERYKALRRGARFIFDIANDNWASCPGRLLYTRRTNQGVPWVPDALLPALSKPLLKLDKRGWIPYRTGNRLMVVERL